jgi:hypothetical protein
VAGVSVKVLVQRTFEIEGRLMKWNSEERRAKAMAPLMRDSDDLGSDTET